MMSTPFTRVSASEFALFAANRLEIWTEMIGLTVEHDDLGSGKIVEVKPRDNAAHAALGPFISIQFLHKSDIVQINSHSSFDKFKEIQIPRHLEQAFSQWRLQWVAEQERKAAEEAAEKERIAAEEAAKRERMVAIKREKAQFKKLADKYKVPLDMVLNNETLAIILLKLDASEELDEFELNWLDENSRFNILATYYYRQYKKGGDLWDLAKTSSSLRKAGLAKEAVKITDIIDGIDNRPVADVKAMAAVFTSRGAAYRDLDYLSRATQCATEAIRLSPSYHAYNLMGALCYEEGNPAEGDRYFDQAINFGADRGPQEAEIRRALQRAGTEARNTVIEYLLNKDAVKYAWVENLRI